MMMIVNGLVVGQQSADEGGRIHGIEENDHDGWVEISDVSGMESSENIAKVGTRWK
jgi:hypothetical protein